MKKLLVFAIVVAALGGALYYWRTRPANAKKDAPKLVTAKVKRGPIRLTVASTGRVVANLEVEIKCKASGEVVKLPFDVSDPVKKGALLLELDPVDEDRKVKQAEVALAASQAKAKQAEEGLRLAELELGTSKKRAATALRSAQTKAKQAEQTLQLAERGLATSKGRAQAALTSAQVKAQDAKSKAARMQTLLEKRLISQEECDTARTAAAQAEMELDNARIGLEELKTEEQALELKRQEVRLAEVALDDARIRIEELTTEEGALELKRQDVHLTAAQVESNRIDLSLAQRRLEETKVVAPIDGVVTARNVQIGQIMSSGISNVGGGTTALTLADLSRIFVVASVDESDIGKVEAGQTALITADAFADRRFRGTVTRVTPKGVVNSNVVTFEVKLEVLGENKSLLKPEMTANVEILAAENDRALLIPATAVARRKRQRVAVVVKEDGTQEERPVEVGIQDGLNLEVTGGLQEGETVVVSKSEAASAWSKARDESGKARGMFGGGGPRR